jgi:MTH538 TIR-like domain (DUF1863).
MDKESTNNGVGNQSQYAYYAFISYQRKDEKWAKWLQRKLENYKLPVANTKGTTDKKSKYIRPVFRDKTDLTAGPLPDALKEALQQSRYLIVICSPNAVQSPWVNEEIETFTKAGRTEYIIPFIVEGEPYSKDGAKECFPTAIKDIPKDKELLGVNINESGKERAFIRTVAYMLNVKFDELWNRFERHRRKIRNLTVACLALLALIALGIYDYTRSKVEYFADWVDCNGVAQGVVPLNNDQVNHRYASFKFEYTRVPFGEKGFYSWRLNRVSIVNSKGVISSSTPDNHAFFYPIQEYKYTDGYVTEIINRDTYNRVAMRYAIKDDYDHKVACLVDMEGKEKHQGSAYLSGSTTAFLSDANPNMSKIKRLHYTRNEKGYITKVTYHANDADELDESAIGDNNNIYGKLFDLDEYGRVTKVTYINHEGNPMTDKFGVGYIRYNNASFERNDTIEYLGSDGELTYNEHRFARQINKLDKYGNPIERYNEGADGKPCYDYNNIYRQVVAFDKNGCFTEIKYYGLDDNLSYCSDNYAIQRVKYDSKGRYIEVSHYDVNEKPCYNKNNYSISRVQYNSNDCIVEQSFYDINDNPCVEKVYGVYCIRTNYDEYNYIVEQSVWDTNNEPSISPLYGFHLQKNEYDDYHRLVKCISYDTKGNRCINTQEYCCEGRYSYDTRGNLTKIECIATDGKPCVCKEGYATITYKYDNYGNCTEVSYYGINNEPIYINMCTSIQYDYYPNGLLKEERYYDERGTLCLNNNWYAIGLYEWDNNGNQTKVSFFDTDTIPCYFKDGLYSILESEYDENGNVVKETYYDSRGNISLNSNGLYAIAKYKYDNNRHIVEYAYFDNLGLPIFTKQKYHIYRSEYDIKGNLVKTSYYNINNQLCEVRKTAIQEYSYDEKSNLIQTIYYDVKNRSTNSDEGYCIQKRKYDNYSRLIEQSYYDNKGKTCWKKGGETFGYYCKTLFTYDDRGNVVKYSYFDVEGKPTRVSGAAVIMIKYDECCRMATRSYFDEHQQLINGMAYQKAIEEYTYDNKSQISQIALYNADSTLYITINYEYDLFGRMISIENRDASNRLKSILIPGVMDTKYAKLLLNWDEKGQNINSSYYDEKGEHSNVDDGFSSLNNTYDNYGHLIKQELFNNKGEPTHSNVQGWHSCEMKYNDKGLVSEYSYYDERGKYVNVNTSHLGGGCKILIEYDEKGSFLNSTIYESVDGKPMISKDSSPTIPVPKKVKGSLIGLRVEFPGHFQEAGYNGFYLLVKWNNWNLYGSLEEFSEEFSKSSSQGKELIFVPWEKVDGEWKLGEIVEESFPQGPLGVRIMDLGWDDIFNTLVDKFEAYKKSKTE